MLTYEQMLAAREQHAAAMKEIKAQIRAEGRDLIDADRKKIDEHQAAFDLLTADIEREERAQAAEQLLAQGRGRRTQPTAPAAAPAPVASSPTVPAEPRTRLFNSLGDFALAVQGHAVGRFDQRLGALTPQAAAGDVITSTDGFPIPTDLRTEIQRAFEASDSIVGRCLTLDTASNEIRMPAFESIPGTAGALRVYWTAENAQITEEKLSMGEFRLPLHKVAALVPVTEEAMADAPLMDSFIRQIVPEFMASEIDNRLITGTGVGQPLGVLQAPATIDVAKEASQPADTINFENLRKMWGRMHPRARANAVWMMGTDLESALMTIAFEVKQSGSTVGGHSIYLPMGSVAGQPYATLFGRPVIVTEHSPVLGDRGDIILADWRRYGFGRKAGGIQIAQSMHLYFDRDKSAFRFTYRVGGQPLLSRPIPQRNGGSTLSAFVTLAERA